MMKKNLAILVVFASMLAGCGQKNVFNSAPIEADKIKKISVESADVYFGIEGISKKHPTTVDAVFFVALNDYPAVFGGHKFAIAMKKKFNLEWKKVKSYGGFWELTPKKAPSPLYEEQLKKESEDMTVDSLKKYLRYVSFDKKFSSVKTKDLANFSADYAKKIGEKIVINRCDYVGEFESWNFLGADRNDLGVKTMKCEFLIGQRKISVEQKINFRKVGNWHFQGKGVFRETSDEK